MHGFHEEIEVRERRERSEELCLRCCSSWIYEALQGRGSHELMISWASSASGMFNASCSEVPSLLETTPAWGCKLGCSGWSVVHNLALQKGAPPVYG